MHGPIRVLVVDDSALMRHRLSTIIDGSPQFEVVGIAASGEECLEKLGALRPDVVTLDVQMPGLDGLATLGRIMETAPVPVLMVSAVTAAGARTTLDALSLGAVDYLAKPSFLSMSTAGSFGAELLAKLAIVAQVRMPKLARKAAPAPLQVLPTLPRPVVPAPAQSTIPSPTPVAGRLPAPAAALLGSCRALVVIGSSTGGPQALDQVFSDLPRDLSVAFLIVQHMPPLFTQSLAVRLARRSGLPAREVQEGDSLVAGTILVAPGGRHVTLGQDRRLHLDETEPIHGVRPAVDRALLSIASNWRGACLVTILTGMGVDGAAGAQAVRARGMEVYAQDEGSSIVFGMPRAVIESGSATAVLPLDRIAAAIASWSGVPSNSAVHVS